MASYVERDGDWVLRPPGRLEHVNMHLFALRAGRAETQALCDKFINVPTKNAVRASPLFPEFPFVLLTCADIAKGYSEDVDDAHFGWMTERDVGFFLPVTLEWNGQRRVANLLPYLYVDNFVAVLIGREVFGFPKVLADIEFGGPSWKCNVTSTVSVTSNPTQPAGPGTILTVVQQTALPGIPLPSELDEALKVFIDALRLALGLPREDHAPFAKIPMVFLKEFRDATNRTTACHQSVVLAEAGIDGFYGGEMWLLPPLPLFHPFSITIPPYYSVDIVKYLGLDTGPTIHPLVAARVAIDFELPFGSTLWAAP